MTIRFKLKPFHFKKHTVSEAKPDTITKLPNELLACIYQHLETKDSLEEFSRTCRKFHHVSKDTRSKAAWMVTRFGTRFAIYYALLSIPERCNQQFLEMMFNMGALVPSHLIQSLLQVYGKQDQSTRRRRRSSFDDLIQLQEEFFSRQVQKLPFEGYVTLLQQQRNVRVQEDDVSLFLSSLDTKSKDWQEMIQEKYFFPAPLLHQDTKKGCYRQVIKLAQTSAKQYQSIATVFEFDPVARAALWESVLLVLFDEAFRSSELTAERKSLLNTVHSIIAQRVELAGPLNDQTIFCQVFAQFFTKYPVGYCNQKTMDKLLTMLNEYVNPTTFGVRHALEYMVLAQTGRQDTIEFIDNFLKK